MKTMNMNVVVLALLVATSAHAQFSTDGTSAGSATGGSGSRLEIRNLAPGKAQFIFTNVAQRDKALFCLTGVGRNWAGNETATKFVLNRMTCSVPKDGKAVLTVSVGDARDIPLGLLPLAVTDNGTLIKFEPHSEGPTLHWFTSRVTKTRGPITLVWVNQEGLFQPATAEQANGFSD